MSVRNYCSCCKRDFSNYRGTKLETGPNNGCSAKNLECYAAACVICSTIHNGHNTFTEDAVNKCIYCEKVVLENECINKNL